MSNVDAILTEAQEVQREREAQHDVKAIGEAIQQHKEGKLNTIEFNAIVASHGGEISFWDPATQRHPAYPKGDNRSRFGFTYHFDSIRGKWFQGVVKDAIKGCIKFTHSTILKRYDEEAFIFDDPRLAAIKAVSDDYISKNFQHSAPIKSDFMHKVFDIILFLMKEDVYYRGRFLELFNLFPKFELSQVEKENIEEYH